MSLVRTCLFMIAVTVAASAQAEWSVQRVNPEVGNMVNINVITRDHANGSIQRLPDRLPTANGFDLNNGVGFDLVTPGDYSAITVSDGVDLYGYNGLGAGVWRNGKADAFQNLHPLGYSDSGISSASAKFLAGSTVKYHGDKIQSHAAVWDAAIGRHTDVHPDIWEQTRIQGIAGGKFGGTVWTPDSLLHPSRPKAAIWSDASGSSVFLLHQPDVQYSEISTGGFGWFGGYIRPGVGREAILWNAVTGARSTLHPGDAYESQVYSIGNDVQVGYVSTIDRRRRPALWHGNVESVVYLETYLPPGYIDSSAYRVWSDGVNTRVAGVARNLDGNYEAVVWTQVVPEPAALALLIRRPRA